MIGTASEKSAAASRRQGVMVGGRHSPRPPRPLKGGMRRRPRQADWNVEFRTGYPARMGRFRPLGVTVLVLLLGLLLFEGAHALWTGRSFLRRPAEVPVPRLRLLDEERQRA